MRNLTTVPSPDTDDALVDLADWAELSALQAADKNASREDLARAIIKAYSIAETTARTHAGDAFREVADRVMSCARIDGHDGVAAYPFQIENNDTVVSVRPGKGADFGLVYKYLLAMTRSDMGSGVRVLDSIDPTKVFERLCADVLAEFWGGRSVHSGAFLFGTAYQNQVTFKSKIEQLCNHIGEGLGWRQDAAAVGGGDGKLDVVAWRRFPDRRQGSLVGFAQCKSGIHWKKSLSQLNPEAFCRRFMTKALILHPLRLYMVPARIESSQWETHTGEGGLLFDRCRILQYAHAITPGVLEDCRRWLKAALAKQQLVQALPSTSPVGRQNRARKR